mgnify:CR=1 FL=1
MSELCDGTFVGRRSFLLTVPVLEVGSPGGHDYVGKLSARAKTSSRFQVPAAVETRPRGHHQVDARDRSRPDPLRSARGTRPRATRKGSRRDARQVKHRVARVLAKDCGRVLRQDGMALDRTGLYRGEAASPLSSSLIRASDVDELGYMVARRKDSRTSRWRSGSNSRPSPPPSLVSACASFVS